MDWKRNISRSISEIWSRVSLSNDFRTGYRVLMYHAVGTKLDDYSIDRNLFHDHMSILKQSNGISLVGFAEGNGYGDTLEVAVTFDDGFKDNLHAAAPIMTDLKIPFTVFVTTKYAKYGVSEYLNVTEIKELASLAGASIGAHGENHLALAGLDKSEIQHELLDSKHYLEDVLGEPVQTMSYPYGSVNHIIRDAAEKAGYTRAACDHWGINDAYNDRLLLFRTMIHPKDSEPIFIQKLKGYWDWYGHLQRDLKLYD